MYKKTEYKFIFFLNHFHKDICNYQHTNRFTQKMESSKEEGNLKKNELNSWMEYFTIEEDDGMGYVAFEFSVE